MTATLQERPVAETGEINATRHVVQIFKIDPPLLDWPDFGTNIAKRLKNGPIWGLGQRRDSSKSRIDRLVVFNDDEYTCSLLAIIREHIDGDRLLLQDQMVIETRDLLEIRKKDVKAILKGIDPGTKYQIYVDHPCEGRPVWLAW